jgi:hypothetical protein
MRFYAGTGLISDENSGNAEQKNSKSMSILMRGGNIFEKDRG